MLAQSDPQPLANFVHVLYLAGWTVGGQAESGPACPCLLWRYLPSSWLPALHPPLTCSCVRNTLPSVPLYEGPGGDQCNEDRVFIPQPLRAKPHLPLGVPLPQPFFLPGLEFWKSQGEGIPVPHCASISPSSAPPSGFTLNPSQCPLDAPSASAGLCPHSPQGKSLQGLVVRKLSGKDRFPVLDDMRNWPFQGSLLMPSLHVLP